MNSENVKKRVAILGGSFNPCTIGHLQMAAELLNNALVDSVWLVPCGQRQDKFILDNQHRLRMLELAIEDFFGGTEFDIQLNDAEIKNGETIPTYDLMKQIEKANPDYEFAFVIGSDLLAGIRKWEKGENLVKEISFYIFQRPGYSITKETLPSSYHIIEAISVSSSSTEVRDRISKAKCPSESTPRLENSQSSHKEKQTQRFRKTYLGVYGVIPRKVIEYIKKHNLY